MAISVSLSYNKFNGSGKTWIAKIDSRTGDRVGYIPARKNIMIDDHRGKKTYELPEGRYLANEEWSRRQDKRIDFLVKDGDFVILQEDYVAAQTKQADY